MTDNREDLEREVRLHDLLREAGDAGLDAGAAERIAAGAWSRAHAVGPHLVRGGERATPPPRLPRRVLRSAWAAAAAAGLLAAFLTPRGATAAFAVEGDPVEVWRGSDWTRSRDVPVGVWAWMPPGTRTIAGPGDARIRAVPGSMFRLRSVTAEGTRWQVEVIGGRVDVEGAGLEVGAGDVHVQRDPGERRFAVTIDLDDGRTGSAAPRNPEGASVPESPRVRVRFGSARVLLGGSTEVLTLGPTERATVVHGGTVVGRRLARLEDFEDVRGELVERVLRGGRVVDARAFEGAAFGVLMELDTDRLSVIEADHGRLEELLGPLNIATWFTTAAETGPGARVRVRTPVGELAIDVDVRSNGLNATGEVREWIHTLDGRRTELRRRGDRSWRLRTPAGDRVFDSLAALAQAAPEEYALFAKHLTD